MKQFFCNGPCEQGKKPCPVPEACSRPETINNKIMRWFINVIMPFGILLFIISVLIWDCLK